MAPALVLKNPIVGSPIVGVAKGKHMTDPAAACPATTIFIALTVEADDGISSFPGELSGLTHAASMTERR